MGLFDWFSNTDDIVEYNNITKEVEKVKDFSNFGKVTEYIYLKSGIVELDKRAFVSSKLQQYAISENIYTTDEFLKNMQNNSAFYQDIINIATVNETFFMREIKELQWLIRYIKEANRPLKILSIPSSSGEETYSIMLLLLMENIDINNISFMGYDINSKAVKYAKAGVYDEHSLHKIDKDIKERYFNEVSQNHYELSSMLRNNARFEQKNIFELSDNYEKYDVILSRNMFIYFDDSNREKALKIITSLLKDGGIYIKGHADYIKSHPNLDNIEFGIYKKSQ